MFDVKALQGLGSDVTFGIVAFVGLALQDFCGRSYKSTPVDLIKILSGRTGEKLSVIDSA